MKAILCLVSDIIPALPLHQLLQTKIISPSSLEIPPPPPTAAEGQAAFPYAYRLPPQSSRTLLNQ